MADRRAEYRQQGWWRDETFSDDLRGLARRWPGKAAMVVRRLAHGDAGTRVVTFAELDRMADRCAGALLELGLRRGDFVALQLPNRWEITPLVLGCWRAGARLCSIGPHYRRQGLRHMIGLTEARVFVTAADLGGEGHAEMLGELADELPALDHVLCFEDARSFFFDTAWEERYPADPSGGRELDPDEPCLVLFTSGTTGESKGSLHSQNTLYAPILGEVGVFGLGPDDVISMATVYTHYTGLVRGILMPLTLGATMTFQDRWEGPDLLDLIEEQPVTFLYGTPGVVLDLVDAQRAAPRGATSLTRIVSGSAPVPSHLVDDVRDAFGVRLYALWGMTENGAVTITRPEDPEDWTAYSDGRPISDMQVRIDPMEGREDGAGPLWVRGPTQCLGYYGRDDLYAANLDEDGWFDTGDLARDDGRGGIRLVGRANDIIQHHAIPVSAVEVEDALTRHPRVREAAVIGIPDGIDEIVCAVLTTTGQKITLTELRDHLKATGMSAMFWPERLEIVDTLPRTETGKVRKNELQQRYSPS
jgi:cyclohexanecarboxylate-CoA ligase